MRKTLGVRIAACVVALALSTNAFAAIQAPDHGLNPVERIIKKIERVLRGLGDVITLPKP